MAWEQVGGGGEYEFNLKKTDCQSQWDPFLVISGNSPKQRHHGLTTLWGLLGGLLINFSAPKRNPSLGCSSWEFKPKWRPCINPSCLGCTLGEVEPKRHPSTNCSPSRCTWTYGSGRYTSTEKNPPIKKDKNFHYLEGTPPELQLGFQTTSTSSEASQTKHRAPEMIRERKNKIKIKI